MALRAPALLLALWLFEAAGAFLPTGGARAPAGDDNLDVSNMLQLIVHAGSGDNNGSAVQNASVDRSKTIPLSWEVAMEEAQEGDGHIFKLETHKGYRYVASSPFMLRWMDQRIHFYDVALYLNKNSSLWGRFSHPNRSQDLEQMQGNVQIFLAMQSSMCSQKSMAALVEALDLFAALRRLTNTAQVLNEYKHCYLSGPNIKMGSVVVLEPNRTHLAIYLDFRPLCVVESGFLGTIVLDHYFSERSDFPHFRDGVFAQIQDGMPEEVTDPVAEYVSTRMPWWVSAMFVAVGLGLCVGMVYGYHTCCRGSPLRE
uniref:Uncharacterized protein n=1 Tax=Alexandrium catenella TaxID=2925 RepID=A0A7S1WN74_ALECA|mmetsp:Transcript_76188/g.202303  ORF Transcript_76188/g.202303 Transcript_76188/m.202303 type:complete len:313 (+) Transcript_76188:108-1046(+)